MESKRADKMFPMNSIQLSQAVGGDLAELFPHVAVDVHTPDLTVFVEIREKYAYVHTPSVPGAGAAIGMGGRAVSLLSGGIDSPVASWMIAKRGVALDMVHFFSYPYTSPEAKDKVLELARLLTPWTGRLTVHVVPFTAIQEELRRSCPEELFTVIMRRFMMRIAQEKGILDFKAHDLRDWTHDRHRTTDDEPYGGGDGLVMKCAPIFEAYESLCAATGKGSIAAPAEPARGRALPLLLNRRLAKLRLGRCRASA